MASFHTEACDCACGGLHDCLFDRVQTSEDNFLVFRDSFRVCLRTNTGFATGLKKQLLTEKCA